MKMFGPKSLSHYLYYICALLAFGCVIIFAFMLLSFGFDNFEVINGEFKVAIPFLSETFIKGIYQRDILIAIALLFVFYILFFLALMGVLKLFKAPLLFTENAIKRLHWFSIVNLLIAPLLYLTIHSLILEKPRFYEDALFLLHVPLGIMVLFTIAIFKKGYNVQSENDLTI